MLFYFIAHETTTLVKAILKHEKNSLFSEKKTHQHHFTDDSE